MMSLAERGLLWSMRLYCWVNDSVPAEPDAMARVLGLPSEELRAALSERVRGFFEPASDRPDRLICVALVRQMEKLMQRREAQVKSALDTAKKRRQKNFQALGDRDGNRSGDRDGLENRTAKSNSTQLGNTAPTSTPGNGGDHDEWLDEYSRSGEKTS